MPIWQGMDILSNSTILDYADDIVIMDNTRHEVATRTDDLI